MFHVSCFLNLNLPGCIMLKKFFQFCFFLVLLASLHGCSVQLKYPRLGPLPEWYEIFIEGEGVDKILIIDISEVITSQPRTSFLGASAPSTVDKIKQILDKAKKDNAVKALLIRINTPGGEITATEIVHQELLNWKADQNKPVVGVIMDLAASGGYYVATACDFLIAHPSSIVGNVGAIFQFVTYDGLMGKLGITNNVIKSGDIKDIGSPYRAMTTKEKEIIQELANTAFDHFVNVVRLGRTEITNRDMEVIKDGRLFSATKALQLHMLDKIGYMDDAINETKKIANLKKALVVTYYNSGLLPKNLYFNSDWDNLDTEFIKQLGRILQPGLMYLWLPESMQ